MCTQKTEVHGGFYITIRSVHWLLEKENVYLQVQDSCWSNLRSKAYEYLFFSPIKYTEHRTTRKMTLVNVVLESLADGISAERAVFVSASPKLLWKRNSGNNIRGSSQHQNQMKHLWEHKWNVLGMQKQPTMQTEKTLQEITSIKLLQFLLKCTATAPL